MESWRSLEARTALAAILLTLSILGGVLAIQDIARLPLTVLVVAGGGASVYAFVSVIVAQRAVIADQAAKLDTAADRTAARVEFGERIAEGEDLARQLKGFRFGGDNLQDDASLRSLGTAVGDWNQRCVETAIRYLGVPANLESPYPDPATKNTRGYIRASLLSEVTTKLERMHAMQLGFM
jgi:hypothetical protein